MFGMDIRAQWLASLLALWLLADLAGLPVAAQAQRGPPGGRPGGRQREPQSDRRRDTRQYATGGASIFEQPPHGGQVVSHLPYIFEVVFQPRSTHVFVYSSLQQPLPAEGIRGEVLMQPHYAPQSMRFLLTPVPPAPGAVEQNHLSCAVDVSQVPDGQMTVTFRLDNLPDRAQPQVAFIRAFALSKQLPQVIIAPVTEGDREAMTRQKTCPVEGAKLGSLGIPVKLLLNDQTLFVCSQDCVAKVQERPLLYVPAPPVARGGVAQADRAATQR